MLNEIDNNSHRKKINKLCYVINVISKIELDDNFDNFLKNGYTTSLQPKNSLKIFFNAIKILICNLNTLLTP